MSASAPEDDAAQQDTPLAENGNVENSVEDQNQPSDMQLSDKQAQDVPVTTSGDSPSDGNAAGDAAGGAAEYDPAAIIPTTTEEASEEASTPTATASVSQPLAKKPKAVGGFLVGDSDSEDEDGHDAPAPVSISASASAPTPAAAAAAVAAQNNNTSQEAEYDPAQVTTQLTSSAPAPAVQVDASSDYDPSSVSAPTKPNPVSVPPPDTVSLLESRIAADPRGSVDSWLALIAEHRQNNRFDDARSVFDRFLELFPQAAEVWTDYIEMELQLDNFNAAEALFAKSLTKVFNVSLWVVYLDYVRRRNVLTDTNTDARNVVSRAYEFVLDNVGLDKDSGKIWQDYVQFIRSGPGVIGGSGWQDQQKMDQLRKAFKRATSIPISNVNQLWKEYDQFEMGLNKITGRKFLAERSPAYMSAKSANTALENFTRGLNRTTIPRLPPVAGFEGNQEYKTQLELWQKWIAWEKEDPLDLRLDEPETLKARILYCYKQALMPMRFWPELWVDAAEWCFENGIKESGREKGLDFLVEGITANPESVLLALKHADHIELTYPVEDGDDAKIARGQAVRAPYDRILKTLRDLHKSLQDKEKAEVTAIEEAFAASAAAKAVKKNGDLDDDDDDDYYNDNGSGAKKDSAAEEKERKITLIKQGYTAQMDLVSKCLTHVWIALARAMRRIQGKGNPQGPVGGMRQVFYDARKGGRLKSDIYVAIAKMEWKCYNDKAGGKILERGSKLFPEDAYFMIEYIKYLTAHGDNTNSRVVFETCVNKLTQKPETVHKAKPLLAYMHKREAEYGDLARVTELEKRMAELYPEDPKLALFSKRFSTEKFDPVGARIIVSAAAQLRPRLIVPSIEKPISSRNSPMPGGSNLRQPNSPRIPYTSGITNSPKRPFPSDDFDDNPPRKILRAADQREFQRGESPLKGAAGRRLDQQRRMQGGQGYVSSAAAGPAPLPTMITFLLGQIPSAAQYNGIRYSAPALVELLRNTDLDPNTAGAGSDRRGGGRSTGRRHGRQVSGEYGSSQYSRNSPGPSGGGRPGSPYGRHAVASSGAYRQSSLRPDSRDSYEPAPAPMAGPVPPSYGQYGAPASSLDNGGWQAQQGANYGAAPAAYPAVGYPPQAQQGGYGGYRFQQN